MREKKKEKRKICEPTKGSSTKLKFAESAGEKCVYKIKGIRVNA